MRRLRLSSSTVVMDNLQLNIENKYKVKHYHKLIYAYVSKQVKTQNIIFHVGVNDDEELRRR